MPTAHTRYSWKFTELDDETKAKAVENVAEKLGGDWWDEGDIESVRQVITYQLAEKVKAPDWDTYGSGDFPGIDGVKLDGWDIERGNHVALTGTLTRENAPGLPWVDGVGDVTLTSSNYGTSVNVEEGDVPFVCTSCGQDAVWDSGYAETKHHVIHVSGGTADDDVQDDDHEPFLLEGLPDREALCRTMEGAVKDAMRAALRAGREEAEYISSEEYAQEWINGNDPDFNEDGTLF